MNDFYKKESKKIMIMTIIQGATLFLTIINAIAYNPNGAIKVINFFKKMIVQIFEHLG